MSSETKTLETRKKHRDEDQAMVFERAKHFVEDVKGEIHRITWTNRDELFFYTKIVVCSTLFFGLAIYALDLIIQTILNSLTYLMHIISG